MGFNKIFILGIGGVGYCLLEIFNLEKLYKGYEFTLIEPRKIEGLDSVMKGRKWKLINEAMTRENYKRILSGLDNKSILINVSINVDSIMLIKLCSEVGAHYIDTSLEQYIDYIQVPVEEINDYSQFKRNNLFHQNIEAIKANSSSRKTKCISSGMNPGLISTLTKQSLVEYARVMGKKLVKGNYAKLAHDLGLEEIRIVETDTQELKIKPSKRLFVNTWSCIGLQEEAGDLVMMSLNKADEDKLIEQGYKLITPDEYKDTRIRFVAGMRGMDMMTKSVNIDEKGRVFEYVGRCIPHAEIITLSQFLQYKGDSPTIFYSYKVSDETDKSLEYFKANNYHNLPEWQVVRNKDIDGGYDIIGSLLRFKNGDKFGGWTVLGDEDVKKLGIQSGATPLQVVAFINAVVKWIKANPYKGINNSETIPKKYIWKHAKKYLGKLIFKKI